MWEKVYYDGCLYMFAFYDSIKAKLNLIFRLQLLTFLISSVMCRVLIDTGMLMNTWGMRAVGTQPGGDGMGKLGSDTYDFANPAIMYTFYEHQKITYI